MTPPDVFSQTLLAVPMYALLELALLLCAASAGPGIASRNHAWRLPSGLLQAKPYDAFQALRSWGWPAARHGSRRPGGSGRHANLEALMDARAAREILRDSAGVTSATSRSANPAASSLNLRKLFENTEQAARLEPQQCRPDQLDVIALQVELRAMRFERETVGGSRKIRS